MLAPVIIRCVGVRYGVVKPPGAGATAMGAAGRTTHALFLPTAGYTAPNGLRAAGLNNRDLVAGTRDRWGGFVAAGTTVALVRLPNGRGCPLRVIDDAGTVVGVAPVVDAGPARAFVRDTADARVLDPLPGDDTCGAKPTTRSWNMTGYGACWAAGATILLGCRAR